MQRDGRTRAAVINTMSESAIQYIRMIVSELEKIEHDHDEYTLLLERDLREIRTENAQLREKYEAAQVERNRYEIDFLQARQTIDALTKELRLLEEKSRFNKTLKRKKKRRLDNVDSSSTTASFYKPAEKRRFFDSRDTATAQNLSEVATVPISTTIGADDTARVVNNVAVRTTTHARNIEPVMTATNVPEIVTIQTLTFEDILNKPIPNDVSQQQQNIPNSLINEFDRYHNDSAMQQIARSQQTRDVEVATPRRECDDAAKISRDAAQFAKVSTVESRASAANDPVVEQKASTSKSTNSLNKSNRSRTPKRRCSLEDDDSTDYESSSSDDCSSSSSDDCSSSSSDDCSSSSSDDCSSSSSDDCSSSSSDSSSDSDENDIETTIGPSKNDARTTAEENQNIPDEIGSPQQRTIDVAITEDNNRPSTIVYTVTPSWIRMVSNNDVSRITCSVTMKYGTFGEVRFDEVASTFDFAFVGDDGERRVVPIPLAKPIMKLFRERKVPSFAFDAYVPIHDTTMKCSIVHVASNIERATRDAIFSILKKWRIKLRDLTVNKGLTVNSFDLTDGRNGSAILSIGGTDYYFVPREFKLIFGVCGTYYHKKRFFHLCARTKDDSLIYCGDAHATAGDLAYLIRDIPNVPNTTFFNGIVRKVLVAFRDFDNDRLLKARIVSNVNNDIPLSYLESFYPNFSRSDQARVIPNQLLTVDKKKSY